MVVFFPQDGADPSVRSKALSYDQLAYMQVYCFIYVLSGG